MLRPRSCPRPMNSSDPRLPPLPVPGQLIDGKYRVEHLVGKGGMGVVFAARHEILEQRVALKLLSADATRDPGSVARFLHEARAAARIQGQHVARVLDVGLLEAGVPFMVLEYLEGVDFSALLAERGTLTVADAVDFVLQALEALA